MRAEPARYELHFEDETHRETNPSRCRVWHRRGQQPTLPGVGTNRRVTVFGSVALLGRTRIALVRAAQDTAGFVRDRERLEAHQQAVQREISLVLDNGSAPTSQASLPVLAARREWLHVLWLAKYAPQLNPQRARVAPAQAGRTQSPGRRSAHVRRRHSRGLTAVGRHELHHRRRGAAVVPRGPPQAAYGAPTRSSRGGQGLLQASALSPQEELTREYLLTAA